MAEFVGCPVFIPGNAWEPHSSDTTGYVKKALPPSKTFPSGRLEVVLSEGKGARHSSWLWEVDKFQPDWVTGPPAQRSLPTPSPARRGRPQSPLSARARRRSSSRTGAEATRSPSPRRLRPRPHREPSAAAANPLVDALDDFKPPAFLHSPPSAGVLPTGIKDEVLSSAQPTGPELNSDLPYNPSTEHATGMQPTTGKHISALNQPKSVSFAGLPDSQPIEHTSATTSTCGVPFHTSAPHDPAATDAAIHSRTGPQIHTHAPSALSPQQVTRNWLLLVGVAVPAVLYGWFLCTQCAAASRSDAVPVWASSSVPPWSLGAVTTALVRDTARAVQEFLGHGGARFNRAAWCWVGLHAPIATVNMVFLLNVDILFWVIAMISKSTWLIDPYWTLIPPLIGAFYWAHPAASRSPRSAAAMGMLMLWSVRLTHSYLRRERWQLGAREDWRYADMAAAAGRHWWWQSILAVYVAQHAMLVGLTLPLAPLAQAPGPWGAADWVALSVCAAGLLLATAADNQLATYMAAKERNEDVPEVLDTGLWRYSRHPNYLGEQLWWWGLGLWAACVGAPWTLVGAAFNSLCMYGVTVLTEARMLARSTRAAAYRDYQCRTSMWLLLPPRPSARPPSTGDSKVKQP